MYPRDLSDDTGGDLHSCVEAGLAGAASGAVMSRRPSSSYSGSTFGREAPAATSFVDAGAGDVGTAGLTTGTGAAGVSGDADGRVTAAGAVAINGLRGNPGRAGGGAAGGWIHRLCTSCQYQFGPGHGGRSELATVTVAGDGRIGVCGTVAVGFCGGRGILGK